MLALGVRVNMFNFAAVLPASYTITISANGFRSWEERSIVMTQGNNLNVPNIKLEVGSSKQEIQVVGNEVTVPTDTGAVSHTLNEQMITELAIQGRDAAELMKMMTDAGIKVLDGTAYERDGIGFLFKCRFNNRI